MQTFFATSDCSAMFQQTFSKIHFLILPMFFLAKPPSLKAVKKSREESCPDFHERKDFYFR